MNPKLSLDYWSCLLSLGKPLLDLIDQLQYEAVLLSHQSRPFWTTPVFRDIFRRVKQLQSLLVQASICLLKGCDPSSAVHISGKAQELEAFTSSVEQCSLW